MCHFALTYRCGVHFVVSIISSQPHSAPAMATHVAERVPKDAAAAALPAVDQVLMVLDEAEGEENRTEALATEEESAGESEEEGEDEAADAGPDEFVDEDDRDEFGAEEDDEIED